MRAKHSTQDVKSPVSPAKPSYGPQKSPLMRGPLCQTGSKPSDPKGESRRTNLTATKREVDLTLELSKH